MHLSLVDMAAGSFFSPLQSSVIFLSMSKWWLLLVHLWNANGDDAHHLSNKNLVCVDPVEVMDWQQNEAFIHACCLVSPYLWKMQHTRFESVACMVLLKIPWRSYGNWDVDPSKVATVGMLVRGLVVFNS
ncbi:hypothetical protein AAG906_028420 [Vitis piasezkii]